MEQSRALSFKRHAVPIYLQDASICDLACFCTLVGHFCSTSQSLKGTQKEKYSINNFLYPIARWLLWILVYNKCVIALQTMIR